jgi:decaprenyl-phosphate phosphoribosyltransferase
MLLRFNYFLQALRPNQWSKNLLVVAAPFLSGFDVNGSWIKLITGVIAFIVSSSLIYVLNDLNDIEIDSKHPRKKFRPFASKALSYENGLSIIVVLAICLVIFSFFLPVQFNSVILIYIFINILYTFLLKDAPVIEIFVVSSGFVLRLVAGALLFDLSISNWFLIVGGFGAFFLTTSKRISEFSKTGHQPVRKVLASYTLSFLESCMTVSISICIMSYLIWAFMKAENQIWFQLSIIPFSIGIFRYLLISSTKTTEAPEDIVFSDSYLITLGISYVTILSLAVYL